MKKNNTILITGGHAGTTALATILELQKKNDTLNIIWTGAKYAHSGKKKKTLEFNIFPKYKIKCVPLISGKLQSKFTRHTIPMALKLPLGFIHALQILLKTKPKVVLSFGGFAAVPIVFWAWVLRKPVIIHEQTVVLGQANRVTSHFAKIIAVARKSSLKYTKYKNKVKVVGNPILPQIAAVEPKKSLPKRPTIYITGGSRGSQILNIALAESLDTLLKDFDIIHQTGELDFSNFEKFKSKNYTPKAFFDPMKVYKIYEKADIVVGRSGANTVSEILTTGRPAIFIPIPWTKYDEQTKNAALAQNIGLATILPQSELSSKSLVESINQIRKNWKKMVKSAHSRDALYDEEASTKLSEIVLSFI